ncbi:tetratricopeptide repeat protein [Polluticaenibacter yanchengensis]|uniref:Tetratricopeptide repeat protein n=1 Tax=Polluticaenibacter yanchengensis TaxID=3014562 RepID=A0ABT4UMA5_9BACT|nr:hypothetical protein [Chitinophagaceae bacterium LY-5]
MKYIAIIFAFLLVTIGSQGQVSAVSETMIQSILKINADKNDKEFIKGFINHYKKAQIAYYDDINADLVGVCMKLNTKANTTQLLPAKYSFDDASGKMSLAAIEKDSASLDAKVYNELFIRNPLYIHKNKYYSSLKYHISTDDGKPEFVEADLKMTDARRISFFRKIGDEIFVISLNKNDVNSGDVLLYQFNKKSITGEDYQMIAMEKNRLRNNAKTQVARASYPLFHDYRIDELRSGVRELMYYEPFRKDEVLRAAYRKINTKLDRETIRAFENELKYFAVLNIPDSLKQPLYEEMANINHLSVHALADIYLGKKQYDSAELYFKKSLYELPLVTVSGTTFEKDAHRILYDLGMIYKSWGRQNEAIAYLIPLLASEHNENAADKRLMELLDETVNKQTLKSDIDKAITNFTLNKDGFHHLVFRSIPVRYFQIFISKESFKQEILDSDFYKALNL